MKILKLELERNRIKFLMIQKFGLCWHQNLGRKLDLLFQSVLIQAKWRGQVVKSEIENEKKREGAGIDDAAKFEAKIWKKLVMF